MAFVAIALGGTFVVTRRSSSAPALTTTTSSAADDDHTIFPALRRPGTTYRLTITDKDAKSIAIEVDARAGLARRVSRLSDLLGTESDGAVEVVTVLDSVYLKADPYADQPADQAGRWVKLSRITAAQHPVASKMRVNEMLNVGHVGRGLSIIGEAVNSAAFDRTSKPTRANGLYSWTTKLDSAAQITVRPPLGLPADASVSVTQSADANGFILDETIETTTPSGTRTERFTASSVGKPLLVKIPPADGVLDLTR